MAYEFELVMRDLAIEALKKAHNSFLLGDSQAYESHMDEAVSAIDGIERLGIAADNPRFLWVGRLSCDWCLVDSFRELKAPQKLAKIYQSCYYEPYPVSLVLNKETPYLPYSCRDVFDFYDVSVDEAQGFSEELAYALALYGKMTEGGGDGISLLFQAGLALRNQQYDKALELTHQVENSGCTWLSSHVKDLYMKIGKKMLCE